MRKDSWQIAATIALIFGFASLAATPPDALIENSAVQDMRRLLKALPQSVFPTTYGVDAPWPLDTLLKPLEFREVRKYVANHEPVSGDALLSIISDRDDSLAARA